MREAYQEAFDNYASKATIDECNDAIENLLTILKTDESLKPSQRERWLEDLAGWIRHYRLKTMY